MYEQQEARLKESAYAMQKKAKYENIAHGIVGSNSTACDEPYKATLRDNIRNRLKSARRNQQPVSALEELEYLLRRMIWKTLDPGSTQGYDQTPTVFCLGRAGNGSGGTSGCGRKTRKSD